MLFLLNKNDSCQATIILKTEVLKKWKKIKIISLIS
jgi:hypothetical protein